MYTSSIAWPNLFDVARNRVGVLTDSASVTNRTKLLMLTNPTELYNEPTFGVGLSKYLFKYNTENTYAMIQDKIREQLLWFEPCSVPEQTQFGDGLLYTEPNGSRTAVEYNTLKFTCGVQTTFGDVAITEVEESDGYSR